MYFECYNINTNMLAAVLMRAQQRDLHNPLVARSCKRRVREPWNGAVEEDLESGLRWFS